MQDRVDLKLTQAEHDKVSSVLAGIPGFNSDSCFHQVGDDFFFIPESIAGVDNGPRAVAAEVLVKYVLAH